MRSSVLRYLALMGFFASLLGSKTSAATPDDSWTMFEGSNEGRPMILRGNTGLADIAGKPPLTHRFGIAVPLHSPRENGFPTSEESEELGAIEKALLATFPAPTTRLAVVITTSGFREFVFYTSAPEGVPAAVRRLQSEITGHTLQSYVEPDERWEFYRSFLR